MQRLLADSADTQQLTDDERRPCARRENERHEAHLGGVRVLQQVVVRDRVRHLDLTLVHAQDVTDAHKERDADDSARQDVAGDDEDEVADRQANARLTEVAVRRPLGRREGQGEHGEETQVEPRERVADADAAQQLRVGVLGREGDGDVAVRRDEHHVEETRVDRQHLWTRTWSDVMVDGNTEWRHSGREQRGRHDGRETSHGYGTTR